MLANNLNVLMAERGLTIKEIHEATGLSRTTISNIANNIGGGIQMDTVDILCNYLEVSVADFFIYAPYILNWKSGTYKNIEDPRPKDNPFFGGKRYYVALTAQQGSKIKAITLETYFKKVDDDYDTIMSNNKYDLYVSMGGGNGDTIEEDNLLKITNSLPIRFKEMVHNKIVDMAKEFIIDKLSSENEFSDYYFSANYPTPASELSVLIQTPIKTTPLLLNASMKKFI